MKRLVVVLAFLPFIFSCRQNDVYRQLVAVDSLLKHEYVDSALQRLTAINTDENNSEFIAYYCLLKTQALYKSYLPIKTDSVITISCDYYKDTNDKEKLARSLLYRGNLRIGFGMVVDAMKDYKMAENIVKDMDDDVLKHNVFFMLSYICMSHSEYSLAINYLRKATSCAIRAGRYDYLVYDHKQTSVVYYNEAQYDSSYYYIEKSINAIDLLPKEPAKYRAHIWTGLGVTCYMMNDMDKAKWALEKSISIIPLGSAYVALARIILKEKDTLEAVRLLESGIKVSDSRNNEMELIEMLSRVEQERGNYKRAAELSRKALALKDTIARRQQEENVRALQMEIDHKQEREESEKTKMWLLAGIGVVVVAGVGIVAVMMGRARRHRKQIDEEQQQIATLESENRMVNRELGKAQKTVSRMKREKLEQDKAMRGLQKEWQQHEQAISRGSQLYMELKSGGKIISWTRDDMRCLRAYYDSVDKAFAEEIARKYGQLSPNQYLLALLEHWGKSDDEIMTMMSLSRGALRTTRTRLNQNQNDE